MKTRWIPLLIAAWSLVSLPLESPARAENVDLVFKEFREPLFPVGLKSEGIFSGFAEIIVDINEDGTVADWLPIRSNHHDFVRSVGYVIDKWIFEPRMVEGEPQPMVRYMTINFSHEGIVLVSGNITDVYLNRLHGGKKIYREVAYLSELDQLPEPVHIVPPRIPSDLPPEEREGDVVVTFFIDHEGQVRIPVVTTLEGHRVLAAVAYHSIKDWRFKPPVANGETVIVEARQPFHFGAPEDQVQD